ncbi:hypothetical protein GCM10025777_22960 [Membranihabitans marinus]
MATANIVNGVQASGLVHLPNITHYWRPKMISTAYQYGSPGGSSGAIINFDFAMNNLNNQLRPGCCNGNSSPYITVTLYVNGTRYWRARTPNDDNVESGDFDLYGGATLLSGPSIPWAVSKNAEYLSCCDAKVHNVRIRLPYIAQFNSNSIEFKFQTGEDDAHVRVNSLTATYNIPAPLELTDLNIEKIDNTSLISWLTLSEKNIESFEIERSGNGINFYNIGTVSGQGSSAESLTYSFVDHQPLKGKNYYRLRQNNYDDSHHYSRTMLANFEADHNLKKQFVIQPNPANDFIRIIGEPDLYHHNVRIYSILGNQHIGEYPYQSSMTLPTDHLISGMYYMVIIGPRNEIVKTQLFTKQ